MDTDVVCLNRPVPEAACKPDTWFPIFELAKVLSDSDYLCPHCDRTPILRMRSKGKPTPGVQKRMAELCKFDDGCPSDFMSHAQVLRPGDYRYFVTDDKSHPHSKLPPHTTVRFWLQPNEAYAYVFQKEEPEFREWLSFVIIDMAPLKPDVVLPTRIFPFLLEI